MTPSLIWHRWGGELELINILGWPSRNRVLYLQCTHPITQSLRPFCLLMWCSCHACISISKTLWKIILAFHRLMSRSTPLTHQDLHEMWQAWKPSDALFFAGIGPALKTEGNNSLYSQTDPIRKGPNRFLQSCHDRTAANDTSGQNCASIWLHPSHKAINCLMSLPSTIASIGLSTARRALGILNSVDSIGLAWPVDVPLHLVQWPRSTQNIVGCHSHRCTPTDEIPWAVQLLPLLSCCHLRNHPLTNFSLNLNTSDLK